MIRIISGELFNESWIELDAEVDKYEQQTVIKKWKCKLLKTQVRKQQSWRSSIFFRDFKALFVYKCAENKQFSRVDESNFQRILMQPPHWLNSMLVLAFAALPPPKWPKLSKLPSLF